MKKFQIPSKLNKIGKISDPEKSFQKLLDLARTMNINLDSVVRDENGFLEKAAILDFAMGFISFESCNPKDSQMKLLIKL